VSFGINTSLFCVALAPGFLALSAFYVFGRLPRRAYGTSATIELGALATIALFAHLLFGGIFALFIVPNVIPRLSETPGRIEHLGPALGEHTDEVLKNMLGLSDGELADLQAAQTTSGDERVSGG
jgi:hypothetical protein